MAQMALAALPYVGAAMSVVGSMNSADALQQQAKNTQVVANYKAEQLKQQAGQERAAAQRDSIEKMRKTRLALSRAQALAASSGAGALDPSVMNIMSGITGEGTLDANTSLYQGEERAKGLESNADATKYEGYLTAKGLNVNADNTLFSGLASATTSLFARYGNNGPQAVGTTNIPGADYGYTKMNTYGKWTN